MPAAWQSQFRGILEAGTRAGVLTGGSALQPAHQCAHPRQLLVQLFGRVPVVAVFADAAVVVQHQVGAAADQLHGGGVEALETEVEFPDQKRLRAVHSCCVTVKRGSCRAWNMCSKMRPIAGTPCTSLNGSLKRACG